MSVDNSKLYQPSDIVALDDGRCGMIISTTTARDYMAFEKKVVDEIIESYSNIILYKVIIDGNITYINESNVVGRLCRKNLKKQKL